ncbi:transposase [Vibrio metschnikovii]|uniref:transposase n=1 Tax=Vibrio metschnikovii TaxID=28172 RepID=UPI002878E697|nr:transposase [Vibrio metschnikovii]EKO3601159.1 transposase [Vibrio metschnikovii]EKO3612169.1 transposase [Vibrio metschnikovii]EKO3632868.1 transposase [Vibrio metschnikovii]EKO3678121.1 transposase [Vibrio metschnikovii]
MGFWDTAGKLAKGAANSLEQKANELQATKMRLESKSSDQLKYLIKNDSFFSGSSDTERSIAMKILRERGDI